MSATAYDLQCKGYEPCDCDTTVDIAEAHPTLREVLVDPGHPGNRCRHGREQYDQMMKYATAIRTRTASTEAILRRFMKANAAHPTYQAMIELGRVQKTIFLCRYLRSRELQREINSGLNVVESCNGANSIIYDGKTSETASNRRGEQEMSVLCLRICRATLVYVNVLMIQDILADPEWDGVLTAEDERGLTPLFWSHVLPYGEVKLNMNSRLALTG